MNSSMVAVYGGSFDPVHAAHSAVASLILDQVHPDLLLVVPNAFPPHREQASAPIEKRIDMLELAFAGWERVEISRIEATTDFPNYTINTLEKICRDYASCSIVLTVGSDAFASIDSWKDWERLFDLASWAVVPRSNAPLWDGMGSEMVAWMTERLTDDPAQLGQSGMVFLLPAMLPEISSSGVRACIAQGAPLGDTLAPAVSAYISAESLYVQE